MNLQTPVGQHDEASKVWNQMYQDIDKSFVGVDERTPAYDLPPGWCASAKNKRFRQGRATDRGGIQLCRWGKGDGTTPFSEIYCAINYSNPTDLTVWTILAADGAIWKTCEGNTATPVTMPPGVVLTAETAVMFVQCMNVLVLLRGDDFPPMSMPDLDTGFTVVTQTAAGILAGLSPIPNSSFGAYILNRLALVQGKDFLAMSNIGDYTSYQAVTQTFQINQGDSDRLVGVYMMNNATVVCLKSNSVYNVLNAYGDLGTNATGPFRLTDEYGCVAVRTVVIRGANVYWLSQSGLQSVATTQLNQQQATTTSLSWNLPATFGRINWQHIAGACAEIWDSRLYLAVPLDDAIFKGLAQTFTSGGATGTYTVTAGADYYWAPDQDTESITDGATTWNTEGVVTPAGTTLTVSGIVATYAGTLQAAILGANTGILVYDFINSAWCGSDEADGVICPVQFLRKTIFGRERLLSIGADGWIRLHEEGVEDEALAPAPNYVDVLITALPAAGQTIKIHDSSNTLVTAITATQNAIAGWAINVTLAQAAQNLFQDGVTQLGYDQALQSFWTCGIGTTARQIAGGLRFTGTGGVTPSVKINGVETTGAGAWYYIDSFGLTESGAGSATVIGVTPILSEFVSRAFSCLDGDGKRYISLLAICGTWNPDYTISTLVNGANQSATYLAGITKDRTKYDVQGNADYVVSNINDDHATPKRLDYSVGMDDLTPGQAAVLLGSGMVLDQTQDTIERIAVDERGYWMQVKFNNSTGTHEVKTLLMEILKGDRVAGASV